MRDLSESEGFTYYQLRSLYLSFYSILSQIFEKKISLPIIKNFIFFCSISQEIIEKSWFFIISLESWVFFGKDTLLPRTYFSEEHANLALPGLCYKTFEIFHRCLQIPLLKIFYSKPSLQASFEKFLWDVQLISSGWKFLKLFFMTVNAIKWKFDSATSITQVLSKHKYMVSLSRRYHFMLFRGCLSQILLGPFLNTLTHLIMIILVVLAIV